MRSVLKPRKSKVSNRSAPALARAAAADRPELLAAIAAADAATAYGPGAYFRDLFRRLLIS